MITSIPGIQSLLSAGINFPRRREHTSLPQASRSREVTGPGDGVVALKPMGVRTPGDTPGSIEFPASAGAVAGNDSGGVEGHADEEYTRGTASCVQIPPTTVEARISRNQARPAVELFTICQACGCDVAPGGVCISCDGGIV